MVASNEQIRQVGQDARLVTVVLNHCQWDSLMPPFARPANEGELVVNVDAHRLEWLYEGNTLLYTYHFRCMAARQFDGDVPEEDDLRYRCDLSIDGLFEFTSEHSEATVLDFVKTTGFGVVAPFFRQMLHTLTSSAGWKTALVPLVYGAPAHIEIERQTVAPETSDD